MVVPLELATQLVAQHRLALARLLGEIGVAFDKVLAHWDREGYGYHLVEEQGQVVGCGGLKRNDDPAELNLYYRLVFGAAGQGLAREAARDWVAWCLEWLPTLPIVAAAAEHNAASVATARTCATAASSRAISACARCGCCSTSPIARIWSFTSSSVRGVPKRLMYSGEQ